MIDPVTAMMDAATRWLNGPTGLATVLLLLSIVVSAVTVFLRSDEAKTLSSFVRFVVSIGTLTHDFAQADFMLWVSRKLLMLLVAVPTGASITIAYGYASHAVLAAVFGNMAHGSEGRNVAFSVLLIGAMLLAYDISYHLHQNLQRRTSVLWELTKCITRSR